MEGLVGLGLIFSCSFCATVWDRFSIPTSKRIAATISTGDAVQMSSENVQWDAENRLVGIVQASGATGFVYDGAGHRVQETLGGTVIKQWVWCGNQPCEERDGSGNVTKRFYAQGEQI